MNKNGFVCVCSLTIWGKILALDKFQLENYDNKRKIILKEEKKKRRKSSIQLKFFLIEKKI